jgi:type III restriction enzyme
LRLPVNQDGERIRDEDTNILTVVANESYESFADTLQKEMEKETGIKFGYLEPQIFTNIIETTSS